MHDMCLLTACVLSTKKKKICMADIVRMIGGRDVSWESISVSRPCPQSKPRRRLQNKSLPHIPIAGWFLLICWPGDLGCFLLCCFHRFFTGVPCKPSVDQVHLPTTFRLNRLNWLCTENVSVVQEISCVLFRNYYS